MGFIDGQPQLIIVLDKDMEKWTLKEFLTYDPEDMFSNTILDLNTSLEKGRNFNKTDRESFFADCINKVYEKETNKLEDTKVKLQEDWNKVQDKFLNISSELFNGHGWPQGNYIGFLSIFNCNPRFIDQKSFQCYYKHQEGLVYVCAHEMLHFMFYSYLYSHPELIVGVSEMQIWKVSEIFNVVVLSFPEFVEVTKNPKPRPYPKHKELIPRFEKLWVEDSHVDSFIRNSFYLL